MRKAQLSLDLLFAITLISLTVVGIINLANQEVMGAKTFDKQAQVKVFSIAMRDTIVKAYAVGKSFAIKKEFPLKLEGNEKVMVVLNSTSNELKVEAHLGGRVYTTFERIPVPVRGTTSIELNSSRNYLWVVVEERNGERYVEIREEP